MRGSSDAYDGCVPSPRRTTSSRATLRRRVGAVAHAAALVAAVPAGDAALAQAPATRASEPASAAALQARVAAARRALDGAAAQRAPGAQPVVSWTNWPKWSKWSNWANK